jgi:HlyD family secretion protein
VAVPIGAVASRVRGSDVNLDAKKKEQERREEDAGATVSMGSDDLEEIVFVINEKGELERRVVTTGIQDSRHFEITSGLKGGETVVTGPYSAVSKTLRTGDRVTVVSQEKLFEKK